MFFYRIVVFFFIMLISILCLTHHDILSQLTITSGVMSVHERSVNHISTDDHSLCMCLTVKSHHAFRLGHAPVLPCTGYFTYKQYTCTHKIVSCS